MASLQTVSEYSRHLAETFGSLLAVAERQTSCTHLIVNASNGDASIFETIDSDYQPNAPVFILVAKTRCLSAPGNCWACTDDDEFTEWAENAETWDVNALADEILARLTQAGVTDASVATWKLQT